MAAESRLPRCWHRQFQYAALLLIALASSLAARSAIANIADGFDRADNAALGNGWIEKQASVFAVQSNSLIKGQGYGYRDNVVYRPAVEDVSDVEASIELRLIDANPGYPQIHTRIQSATVAYDGWLDSYVVYVAGSGSQAVLGRQTGSNFVTTLATLAISPALNTTDNFRLRLRTTGTNPVQLAAFVERFSGGAWQVIGQATASDASADRISTAGSVGFSGYIETSYRYDNFVRTNLATVPPNPMPTIGGISPNTATAGESGLILTVTGSNFVANSEVRWNGSARGTTFVSGSILEATIPATDLAAEGIATVTVFNPAPAGGLSGGLSFTVAPANNPNPVPVAGALAPNRVNAGSGAFTLVVTGSSFATDAVVRWNGAARTTTFVSATELRATIAATDVAAAGSASVTVFNPAPAGGTSNALNFTIDTAPNPVPTLGSLNPASRMAGSGAFTLTVTGTNFVPSSVVRWNGANRTTTYVSTTSLTAAIGAADVQAAGSAAVTVFNAAPGGGTSNAVNFTITPSGGGGGAPAIMSVSPVSTTIGAPSVQVTVNGSGFTATSTVRWNGAARPTTYLSATQVRVNLPGSDLLADAIGAITVVNGTSASAPLPFFVLPASDGVFFDGFNRGPSLDVGNGWVEKTPSVFQILSNGTVWAPYTSGIEFHNAIVYRNSAESQLDSESGIDFVRLANSRFPQLHSRVQTDTVGQDWTLESYILYVEDGLQPRGLALAVQPAVYGTGECIVGLIPFPTLPQVGERYRLRLQVRGTYPVQLTGIMEWFNGAAWETFVSGAVTHDANTPDPGLFCPYIGVPEPISTAGTFGFAKWYDEVDAYDNFFWRSLLPGAPVSNIPTVTGMTPSTTVAGSGAFTLTVNGSNYSSNSTVRWNGSNRTTTFISGTELQASIPASDVAMVGTANVSVFNSGSGGGTSPTSLAFMISAPPPGGPGLQFSDDFARANSSALGNGWIEKNSASFSIDAGRALKLSGAGYRDNAAYRPSAEALLDAEVSSEFRILSTSVGYPQIFARLQSATAPIAGTLDGYMLYFNNSTSQAILGRQNGTAFVTTLATLNLTSALNTNDTYRMRLRATGSTTVQLQAFVERFSGGTWTAIGQATASDSSAQRISTTGVAGFSGYTEATYSYDNFSVFNLTP